MFNMVLLVVCVLLLVVIFMLWPGKAQAEKKRPFWGLFIAHRGLHTRDKTVPENSLAAFAAAAQAGYGIELDIRLCKDGEVVVFHDDNLERVCGVKGQVANHTLTQLRALRLHGTTQGIPLLQEVLDTVRGRVPLVVELKGGTENKQLCQKAWQILQAYEGPYCVESFDPRIVRWFKKNARGVLRGQLSAPSKQLGAGPGGIAISTLLCNFISRPQFIAYSVAGKTMLAGLADSGAMRVAWTVRSDKDLQRLQEQNDAIIFEFFKPPVRFKKPPEDDKHSRLL